jgi:transposase-like protein
MNYAAPIELTKEEVAILRDFVGEQHSPRALRLRAEAILGCAEGKANVTIGSELGITNLTVGRWRRDFQENRLNGFALERRGRSARTVVLRGVERETLESWAKSQQISRKLILRAHVVLACAAGQKNSAIARQTGITALTVGNIRKLFLRGGVEALKPNRPGRKPLRHAGVN